MSFKPMLAGKAPADLSTLTFPLLVSPKLDGIRCIIRDGKALSRKLLPIPNRFVQAQLAGLPPGLDGELMLDLPGNFNQVQSAIMSVEGEPDFTYCVFDRDLTDAAILGAQLTMDDIDYSFRLNYVREWHSSLGGCPRVEIVPHALLSSLEELMEHEQLFVSQGFEGLMIRSLRGPYKYGRSTEREGHLLKLKRFEDAEATVIGVEELMHNDNEATTDELGRTKRSSAKEGKRPAGVLGALICQRDDGVKFNIGAGFTAAQRAELWAKRQDIFGWFYSPSKFQRHVAKFKFQPDPSAPNGAPRFPVFLGFRSEIDA